ncbi:MAG: hypothetical protein EZS28_018655 [Streblomastix strix]|uniref:Uncharacterized protein n=1 Tax=Streblomastix strix TaxID=222440 RepID=A0A5J4VTT0_9EUKA|nr:MAG: hypothetical protein EZS28_018655 [Streblomastix strix]
MLSPRQQERQSSYNPDQIAPSRQLSQVSVVAASSVHGEGQQQRTPHKNQFHSIPRSATQSPGPQQSPNPNKLNPQNFLKRSKQPMFLKPAPSAVAQAVQKSGGSVDKELYKTVNQQQQEQQNALLQSQLQQQISTPFTVFNPNQAGDSGAVFVTPQGMKNNDKQGQHKMPVFNANTSPTKTILDILSYTPQCMLNDPFTSSPSKQQMQNSPPRSPLKQQRRGNRTKGDGFGVTSSSAQSNYGDNNDQSQENLLIIKLNRLIGAISIEEQQLKRTTTPVGFEAKLEELLQKRDLELSEVEKKLNELQELHGNPQQ